MYDDRDTLLLVKRKLGEPLENKTLSVPEWKDGIPRNEVHALYENRAKRDALRDRLDESGESWTQPEAQRVAR